MHSLKIHFQELKPALVLLYLSGVGSLCVFSVQMYLGIHFDPLVCLCFMGIVFGIYTSNRFTDATEDFTNDIGRLIFFRRKKVFLFLAVASLAMSVGILAAKANLGWFHFVLLGIGFSYSYRSIPWYSKERGFYLVRVKEMLFVKNLVVSLLWGSAVFVIPILYSSVLIKDRFTIFLLGAGLILSTLNNTLYDDIRDEAGDRVARIKTLPTVWGARNSYLLLWGLDSLWIILVAACWIVGRIDAGHAAFLAFLGFYPLVYMGLGASEKISRHRLDVLAESDLLFFAAGLMLLSLR